MIDASDEIVAETISRLRNLVDPELGINVVDLGLICDVNVDTGARELRVEMTLTTPGCPLSEFMIQGACNLLADLPGIERVDVRLVWDPPWTPDRMSAEGKEQLRLRRDG